MAVPWLLQSAGFIHLSVAVSTRIYVVASFCFHEAVSFSLQVLGRSLLVNWRVVFYGRLTGYSFDHSTLQLLDCQVIVP